MPFAKLNLIEPLLRAVRSEGYTVPTDIQKQAIPHVLVGRDLLGCAQTGTGKTAAFALPILQRLHGLPGGSRGDGGGGRGRPIRVLVITPTRELAAQIGESFGVYGRHTGVRHTVIFGGVGQGPQSQALRNGVDVLVATPGRLLDLLNQRLLTLRNVEVFVLDEADRMLDMGFIDDIRRVIAQLPAKRQTLMFSATMPQEIRGLAGSILDRPIEVRVAAQSPAADTVRQCLYRVSRPDKLPLLERLLRDAQITRALVFTRTKHGADKVAYRLNHSGVAAAAIHANKSQNNRTRTLASFKEGRIRVLVASDIASRGLDVDDISHVINFDLPAEPETYVHRIGRTGRAGAAGQAISFCTEEQRDELRGIERLLGRPIPVLHDHDTIRPGTMAARGRPVPRQPESPHAMHGSPPADPSRPRPHKATGPGGRRGPYRSAAGRRRKRRRLGSSRTG